MGPNGPCYECQHALAPAAHVQHRNLAPRGPTHHSVHLQACSRAQSAVCSQCSRRNWTDTCDAVRTSCSMRELVPRVAVRATTSTRIVAISCANRCSHVPRVDPARQPRPDCPSESCFEALRSTSCGRAASLWIEPWMDSMCAAIFSALSIFSTTSSTSRPGWRMPKKRRHSHQRDDRDSAETSPRASNRHFPSWRAQGPSLRFCPGAFYTVVRRTCARWSDDFHPHRRALRLPSP